MISLLVKTTLLLQLILVSILLAQPGNTYRVVPNPGYTTVQNGSLEEKWLLRAYKQFSQGNVAERFSVDSAIQLDQAIDLSVPDQAIIQKGAELIKQGLVTIVTSAVGSWTRGHTPDGRRAPYGKAPIEFVHGTSFLEAHIITAAMATAAYSDFDKPVNIVIWVSQENEPAIRGLLEKMPERISTNTNLGPRTKATVLEYLKRKIPILMPYGKLYPVIHDGEAFYEVTRTLGAGVLVPALKESGVMEMLDIRPDNDSVVIFGNIETPLQPEVIAGAAAQNGTDMLQLHVKKLESDVGGGAFWVYFGSNKVLVPLEVVEVPKDIYRAAQTFNTNTVALRRSALITEAYDELPVPFEEKTYTIGGRRISLILPKVSLADRGKLHGVGPDGLMLGVKFKVAIGTRQLVYPGWAKSWDGIIAHGDDCFVLRRKYWTALARIADPHVDLTEAQGCHEFFNAIHPEDLYIPGS